MRARREGVGWALFWLLANLLGCAQTAAAGPPVEEVRIGVLMRHRHLEESLNRTLEMLNADNSVLFNTRLTAIVERLHSDSSYEASAVVCRLLERRVWAIVGPQSVQLTAIVQSISAAYHIPLVLINWQPLSHHADEEAAAAGSKLRKRQSASSSSNGGDVPGRLNYTINLHPLADELSRAYLDLIRYKEWKSFTLVYDDSESFLLVRDIFEASFGDTAISVQRISPTHEEREQEQPADSEEEGAPSEWRDFADSANSAGPSRMRRPSAGQCNFERPSNGSLSYKKLVKDLRKRAVENLVLSMSLDKVCRLLREAASAGLLTFYNDYVIANLDAHLLDLSALQPLMSNISAFSILEPDGQQTEFAPSRRWLGKRPSERPKRLLSTESAMLSDAITLVAHALDELIGGAGLGLGAGQPPLAGPDCSCARPASQTAWQAGASLMELFKRAPRLGGYTGDLSFDQFGQRVHFSLELVLHKNNTFRRAGAWSAGAGISERSAQASPLDFGLLAIKNKTLRVSIALTPPYVMHKERHAELAGNERYEGYCIDLLNKLARKLQFSFQLREVLDGQYGKIQNGSWTGMVRELLVGQADLAIVDLTITKERQSAVDFTHPFMTLGIAIMYKKPKLEEAELYSFLMPLSHEVWLSMWSAYVGISLTLWLISRLSPLEWKNPHPCFERADERDLENEIHSIGASLWFTIGSLMQQGSDLAPRSPSVRALASVWYFFTLILISSYTANFAAFLTASRMQSPIESAEDLSKQTRIDYGCKEGGSTQAFFASSNHSTYRRMWNFMESRKHQGVFPKDNDKGITRVKKGNFAFLMESTSIEYIRQRDCELTQIGGLLDHKGYGIALRKRSPFRAPLSKAIVELNEAGELQDLKNRWWSTEESQCDQEEDSALATSELGIDKVGGVFVLLGAGVGIACCAAILEFVWKSLKTPKDQRDTITVELWHELLRILRFGPSKRAAAETLYHRSTSQASETASLNNRAGNNYAGRPASARAPVYAPESV